VDTPRDVFDFDLDTFHTFRSQREAYVLVDSAALSVLYTPCRTRQALPWTGPRPVLLARSLGLPHPGSISTAAPLCQPSRAMVAPARRHHVVRASRESGSFWSGMAIGGVVFGVLGFVFAPQISQALLGDDQRLRLPRFLEEEEEDPEVTKYVLMRRGPMT
jgi:hypothetical protein